MKGGFQIPTYTSKDVPIMIATMLPMTCLINYYLFGNTYFNDFPVFIKATLVTFFLVSSAFLTYGFVAISLRNRFPHDAQSFQRLFIFPQRNERASRRQNESLAGRWRFSSLEKKTTPTGLSRRAFDDYRQLKS